MTKTLVASFEFSATKEELQAARKDGVLRHVQCTADFAALVERLRIKVAGAAFQSLMDEAADAIEKLTAERAFIVGCNQGYDTAMSQVTALLRLDGLRAAHAAWSQTQFGEVSAIGPAKHLAKEALEVAEAPHNVIEHADCWMLLWDMQRRAGISDEALADAIRTKLALNMARDWPEPKEGEPREHVKPASSAYEAGEAAYFYKVGPNGNPYDAVAQAQDHLNWKAGWDDAANLCWE